MPNFTARPTVYNGIHMRSRLEATFAGFLDEAGFEWAYEPRAYGSGRAQYLPDFEVTFSGADPIYFEVKGLIEPVYDVRLGVLRRMEIILQSDPTARLAVVEANQFALGNYTFPLFDPIWPNPTGYVPGWRAGRFAMCRCGSTYLVPVVGHRPLEVCGACDQDDLIAWLDPTSRRG